MNSHFTSRISKEQAHEEGYEAKEPEYKYSYMECISTEELPVLRLQEDWFSALAGGLFEFYGMGHHSVKLNDIIYEFLADPDDGYRSHLGSVKVNEKDNNDIFFVKPITKIILVDSQAENTWPAGWTPPSRGKYSDRQEVGYYFVDTYDNHTWGFVGTNWDDSYYPSFSVRYCPRSPPGDTD